MPAPFPPGFLSPTQTMPLPTRMIDYTDGTYNYYGYAKSDTLLTDTGWLWQRVRIAAIAGAVTNAITWTGAAGNFNQTSTSPQTKAYIEL